VCGSDGNCCEASCLSKIAHFETCWRAGRRFRSAQPQVFADHLEDGPSSAKRLLGDRCGHPSFISATDGGGTCSVVLNLHALEQEVVESLFQQSTSLAPRVLADEVTW